MSFSQGAGESLVLKSKKEKSIKQEGGVEGREGATRHKERTYSGRVHVELHSSGSDKRQCPLHGVLRLEHNWNTI